MLPRAAGGSRSMPMRSPLPSSTCSGRISSLKPLSSSFARKCSLPMETTRCPLSRSRWCQLGGSPLIGSRVVPTLRLMHPPPGCQRGASRDADGTGRVGVAEARAAGGEHVDVGRDGDRIAIAAGYVAAMLVRQDEKEIARLHWRYSGGKETLTEVARGPALRQDHMMALCHNRMEWVTHGARPGPLFQCRRAPRQLQRRSQGPRHDAAGSDESRAAARSLTGLRPLR